MKYTLDDCVRALVPRKTADKHGPWATPEHLLNAHGIVDKLLPCPYCKPKRKRSKNASA